MTTSLLDGELVVTAQIRSASNVTLRGRIGTTEVVYKPVRGERPLWDFPDGTLAQREVAAYLVSHAFARGTDDGVVPRTWLRDGPLGPGMVQEWCASDPSQEAVTLVPADALPAGWRHVVDGLDADDRPVSLVHEDSPALRRIAVFDLVVNNADRKGGHVLETGPGRRAGIDHGLTFHRDHKLRTVLWGWIGQAMDAAEVAGITAVRDALDADLGDALHDLLTPDEVDALALRCDRLLVDPVFPAPSGPMPAVPWPPF